MTYVDISVDNPIRPYNLIMECTDHDKVMDIYVAILLEELISNIGHPDIHTWTPCVLHNQDDQVPRCVSSCPGPAPRDGDVESVYKFVSDKRRNGLIWTF